MSKGKRKRNYHLRGQSALVRSQFDKHPHVRAIQEARIEEMSHKYDKLKSRIPQSVFLMVSPKGAFTAAEFAQLVDDFADAGIKLIQAKYNNNVVSAPRFERLP